MHTNPFRHARRPDVMSQQEIRWWIQELRRRGWRQNCLGRTLGLANPRNVWRKADGREWIYRSEQIRMNYVLKRIISGELVQLEGGKRGRPDLNGHVAKAVIADHPQPLRPCLHWHIDFRLATARLEPTEPPAPTLPNFRSLLENPRPWRKP